MLGQWARIGFGVLALGMAAAASQVLDREIVATALVAGAIVFAVLALIGRLPAQVTMGGVSLEYREMVAEDLARALRGYTITYNGDIVRRDSFGEDEPRPEPKGSR